MFARGYPSISHDKTSDTVDGSEVPDKQTEKEQKTIHLRLVVFRHIISLRFSTWQVEIGGGFFQMGFLGW